MTTAKQVLPVVCGLSILVVTLLLAACDNPIEKSTREQLSAPIAQNASYAIDDLLHALRPGIDCDWARRDAATLREQVADPGVRDRIAALRQRAGDTGCLR